MMLCLGVPAQTAPQSGAGLLQEGRAFFLVDLPPHGPAPLAAGAPLERNLEPSPASIEAAPAVGKHSPLLSLPARTESKREEEFSTGVVVAHKWPTGSAAEEMRRRKPTAAAGARLPRRTA